MKTINIGENSIISFEEKKHIKNVIKQILKKTLLINKIEHFTNLELYIIILDKLDIKNYNKKLIIECVNEIIAEKQINNLIDTTKQDTQTLLCAV